MQIPCKTWEAKNVRKNNTQNGEAQNVGKDTICFQLQHGSTTGVIEIRNEKNHNIYCNIQHMLRHSMWGYPPP